MRFIDLDSWPRRGQFELYRACADPFFDLAVSVRTPGLAERCRQAGWSPFPVIVAGLCEAMTQHEALRMRIRGERVVVHDQVHPSWVVRAEDGRLGFARGRAYEDLAAQLAEVRDATAQTRAAPSMAAPHQRDDLFYVSSLAPLDLLGVHPDRSGLPDDTVPRFFWGRLHEAHLVISLSVHHALVDGMHLPPFVESLERALERPLPPLTTARSPSGSPPRSR